MLQFKRNRTKSLGADKGEGYRRSRSGSRSRLLLSAADRINSYDDRSKSGGGVGSLLVACIVGRTSRPTKMAAGSETSSCADLGAPFPHATSDVK